ESWKKRFDEVSAWLGQHHMELLTMFPAVLEGALSPNTPALDQMGPIEAPYWRLIKEPSVDHLLVMTPAIHRYGFPPEARASLDAIVSIIRRNSAALDDEVTLKALKLIAHVAVMTHDRKLADAVAEASIERLPLLTSRQTVL